MLLLCALIVGVSSAWAANDTPQWSYEIGTNDATKLNTADKTFTVDKDHVLSFAESEVGQGSPSIVYQSTGNIKFGTSKTVYFNPVVITTDAFKNVNVTKVAITVKHNGKVGATLTVKQGDVTIGTGTGATQNTSYQTVTCSTTKKGGGGTLTISYAIAQALFLSKIEVWYEDNVTKHSLSSVVTPAGVGTVTLGATEIGEGKTTTISATATDAAYRFKNWSVVNGTVADANAASTTFTMGTVGDATVTANFDEKQKSTITVTPTTDGIITVKNGDDVVASGSSVYEGTELTITAAAGEGKKFNKWSITGATPASTTEATTTLTVGTSDVTIAATFDDVETRPVNWYVNGTKIRTDNIPVGDAITFTAPENEIPTGYTFQYWSSSEIDGVSATAAGTKVTSQTAETGVDYNYYAVMALGSTTYVTATLTADSSWNSYMDKTFTDDKGNTWKANCSGQNNSGTYVYGLNTNNGSYVESPNLGGTITEIKMLPWNGSSSAARTFYIKSTKDETTADLGTISVGAGNKANTEVTATLNETSFSKFYLGVSAALSFNKIIVTYASNSYSNYCTTIPTATVAITSAGLATYVSDHALDYTNVTGLEAYIAKEGAGAIKLTKVNKVPAGTGVLLRSTDEGTSYTVPVFTTSADDVTGNLFKRGTGAAVVSTPSTGVYNYILNKVGDAVGFYRANNQTVATNRAYLQTSIDATEARLSISFDEDDNITTGIRSLTPASSPKGEGSIYTLSGQKVQNPKKGLYIVNGKKVLVP